MLSACIADVIGNIYNACLVSSVQSYSKERPREPVLSQQLQVAGLGRSLRLPAALSGH